MISRDRKVLDGITPVASRQGSTSPLRGHQTPQKAMSPAKNSPNQRSMKKKSSLSNFPEYAQSTSSGIIHFALLDLFQFMEENTEKKFELSCSYMEIYNELIYDLLVDRNRFKVETLNVCEDHDKGFYVKNLTDYKVTSMQ